MDHSQKRTRGKLRVESAAPAFVSQRNCQAVLGISQRQHLRLAREWHLPARRVGQAVLVPIGPYLEAIERHGIPVNDCDDSPAETSTPTPESVAARLGVIIND